MSQPLFVKKTDENEYVVMDMETFGAIEGVKAVAIVAAFIAMLPVMIIAAIVYFVYKCMIICEWNGMNKKLALIPGYNLWLFSKFVCGSGYVAPVFLVSLATFLLTGFSVMGAPLDSMGLFMIASTQVVLNIISMILNYKFYHRCGNWYLNEKLLTFIPQLTCVMAGINLLGTLLNIKKEKKK